MAVYTQIKDNELHNFLTRYDLGEYQNISGIAEGVENSNYLLKTDKSQFILTLYEKRVDAKDLPFFIELMEHLSSAGVRCPVPVKDCNGQILQKLAGRPATIVTFLEGTSRRYPNVKKCYALGSILAAFHLKSENFRGTRKNALGPNGWQPLLSSITHIPDDMPHDLLQNAQIALDNILISWPKHLPSGYIHADLFPNNVLFVGDELTGIIDFYFAAQDLYSYDLAVCLNSWCFDPDGCFNITKSHAILKGYQDSRPLTIDEKATLSILCQGAAMRFFLTRLYDWIHTPVEALVKPLNPLDFWKRLRFHQAAKGPQAYGLWD